MRAFVAVAVLVSGCYTDDPYTCTDDHSCIHSGRTGGACLSDAQGRYCAYADQSCPSGMRWSPAAAPTISGTCVARAPDAGVDSGVVDLAGDLTFVCGKAGEACCAGMMCAPHAVCSGNKCIASDAWLGGYADVKAAAWHWTGMAWNPEPNVPGLNTPLFSLWGTATDDVWGVGASGYVIHWDGNVWSRCMNGNTSCPTAATTKTLYTVRGSSSKDIWAVGEEAIFWNGTTWTNRSGGLPMSGLNLYGLWEAAPNDIWASSYDGDIFHWTNGPNWASAGQFAGVRLLAMWGFAANDIWVVGQEAGSLHNFISHYDGNIWSNRVVPDGGGPNQQLKCVWGASPNDVWAGGGNGALLHWDGNKWSTVDVGTTKFIFAIWGAATNDVWAAGSDGLLMYWNGSNWTILPAAVNAPPYSSLWVNWR